MPERQLGSDSAGGRAFDESHLYQERFVDLFYGPFLLADCDGQRRHTNRATVKLLYDGSYDRFLLKENITIQDVSFGFGGKAGPLDGPGLGVEVNRNALERLSDSDIITIKNPN